MIPGRFLPRPLPEPLEGLATLASDMVWSWNHAADKLWKTVAPDLWEATGNPWLILESVSQRRLEELAGNEAFLSQMKEQLAAREEALQGATWFEDAYPDKGLKPVAYFSMEFGLSEALPIYSGGLGVLAGDHLKTASDLGVPLVGVGLLYQQGYFHQAVDANGEQLAFFPYNDPTMLPVVPLRNQEGEWLRINLEFPGRTLRLRTWEVQVGRIRLLLLDSNDPLNVPGDRGITGELYGGGPEMRLQQEIVLGIGGWRLLEAMGFDCEVCHLNEGHAAFAVLERARSFMDTADQPFSVALRATRAGNIFTTHTPVAAGFDRFAPPLFAQYFEHYARERLGIEFRQLMALGRTGSVGDDEPFNMAYLAFHGCGHINGVSQLHGEVSRRIFQPLFPRWPRSGVPVGHVTNGVHVATWDSAIADRLWTEACGKARWRGALETLENDLRNVDDKTLWRFRSEGRQTLVHSTRERLVHQLAARGDAAQRHVACEAVLDPNALTIGFARRFATYKRVDLLLHDPARLTRLLTNPERPVQLIIAGKAHPQDEAGKRMIRAWTDFIRRPEVRNQVVFIEDYDLAVAADLVQGIDLWINTPRRPWEASGTSGMKVLVNGGLNLSELDGWWAEAYSPEVGWALGDGREHDSDPAWDAQEAEALYYILEHEVVPAFYDRDADGIPTAWVARIRESMARLTPAFSTNRMVREYAENYYLPAAEGFRQRAADNARLAEELEQWHTNIVQHWPRLHFGRLAVEHGADGHRFQVQVYLDELDPDAVQVELYAESDAAGDGHECHVMVRGSELTGAVNSYIFSADIVTERSADEFTPRIVPTHPQAFVPLEAKPILWER